MKLVLLVFSIIMAGFAPNINADAHNQYSRNNLINPMLKTEDRLIENILSKRPEQFAEILRRKDELGIQVIYTEINRGKDQQVKFTNHFFNTDSNRYFYPASTVKFPIAVLALQKLNELHISKYATMITGKDRFEQTNVLSDSSAPAKKPTIAHYIKKILLVSDNDAFNRLYEFLGQEYINTTLHKMGYNNTQIIHRLSVSLSDEQNRNTNPVNFYDENSGKLLYTKSAETSRLKYDTRDIKLGIGYMQGEKLINEPLDFSKKNRFLLTDLHDIVKSVMFPESIEPSRRFNLKKEDYDFLRLYMSMTPPESVSPKYDTTEYWDNYVKMIYYGAEKTEPEPGIRIFGKTGTAYGFLIESCYFVDFNKGIDFMLSAVIYCNSDGVLNDDKYDYATLGYPFFKNLGKAIYDHEVKRKRKSKSNLSTFRYNYSLQK